MYKIIDERGSGKTSRLMLLAKENHGIIVCANPYAMAAKAEAYGLSGLEFVSYKDYSTKNYDTSKPTFIDELDLYVANYLDKNLQGYCLTVGD